MQFYPGNVEVEVLDPIETDKWSKDTVDDHVEHVKSIMTKSLAQRN